MKQVNFRSREDIEKLDQIFARYKHTYPVYGHSVGYFSDDEQSAMTCNSNPIGMPIEVIAKEFHIMSKPEHIDEMVKKMRRMIFRQKFDIVSVSINNEHKDLFKGYRVLFDYEPRSPVIRFEMVINKEKIKESIRKLKERNQLRRQPRDTEKDQEAT